MKLISVVVPAYKQQNNIASDLKKIHQELKTLPFKSEIICVVDGSPDKTFERAKKFARYKRNVKIISYPENKGKGYAVKHGLKHSRGDIVGFIDAGGDVEPRGIKFLLAYFDFFDADIVIGSKRHPHSIVNYPWQRKILSYFYQLLIQILFRINIKDTQVGIKFYKRKVIKKVLPKVTSQKYAFDIEILAIASHLGFKKIYEVPAEITLDFGGKSVITGKRLFFTVLTMLKDTFRIFLKLQQLKSKNASKITEDRLGIEGDYQFKAINSKNFLQANWHRNKLIAVDQLLVLNKKSRILDVGTGSGNFELEFASKAKSVIGLDYNSKSLKFLRAMLKKRKIKNVRLKNLDIKDLAKLKSVKNLDTIVMIDVIEHLNKKTIKNMTKEFERMLKKGGQICIVTPNYKSLWTFIEKTTDALRLLPQMDDEQHITQFDESNLAKLFEKTSCRLTTLKSFNLVSFAMPFKDWSKKLTQLELSLPLNKGNLLIAIFEKQ